MLHVGDIVQHNDFPPIDGMVSIIQEGKCGNRIGVLRKDTGTIYWDDESTWNVLPYMEPDGSMVTPSNNVEERYSFDESEVVDAEYVDVESND